MNNSYENYLHDINQLFCNDFLYAYKNFKVKGKTKLLNHISHYYKLWYYSALVNDTIISPANLTYTLTKNTLPSPTLTKRGNRIDISFKYHQYSTTAHPVVLDYKTVIDGIFPITNIDEHDIIPASIRDVLISQLSIQDPHYLEYLIIIATKLNHITQMPAIHSFKLLVTDEYKHFSKLTDAEIFVAITEETIKLSSELLRDLAPNSSEVINTDYIRSILKTPIAVNDIINTISYQNEIDFDLFEIGDYLPDFNNQPLDFSSLDVDDFEPLDFSPIEPNPFLDMMEMSTFILSPLLDKCFFTLFGYYLKLIQPLYKDSMDFESAFLSMNFYGYSDVTPSLYNICSCYSQTLLGKEYFASKVIHTDNYMIQPTVSDITLVSKTLDVIEKHNLGFFALDKISSYYKSNFKEILQIKFFLNKKQWKIINIPSSFTLHQLHQFICDEFSGFDFNKYVFYINNTLDPFTKYTPEDNKRRYKKTKNTELKQLNFYENQKIVYVNEAWVNPEKIRKAPSTKVCNLEIVKIQKPSGMFFYPRVSDMSVNFEF